MNTAVKKVAEGHTYYDDLLGALTADKVLERVSDVLGERISVQDDKPGYGYGHKAFKIDVVVTEL